MDFQTPWIKYGVIYGIISICLFLFSAYVSPLGIWTQLMLGLVIMIVLMVLSANEEKASKEGILNYGEALKNTFLTGFTGFVISGLTTLIMVHLVDPSLLGILQEQAVESVESMMKFFGAPDDAISEALEKAEADMEAQFTPVSQILNILKSSIMVVIIAAIVSIFVKKNENIHDIKL
jgi:hypothetical protein